MDNSIVTLDLKDSYLSISDSRIYLPNKEIVDFYKQIIEIDIRNKRTDELSQKRLN
jgi:tmRNA-binding protein